MTWLVVSMLLLIACCDGSIDEIRKLRNTGLQLKSQGKMEEALKVMEECVEKVRKLATQDMSIEHASFYSQVLSDYGLTCGQMKKYTAAIEVLNASVQLTTRVFGPSHPAFSFALQTLAQIYEETHEIDKAIETYETIQVHMKQGLGESHESYIELLVQLAQLHLLQQKFPKVITLLQDHVKTNNVDVLVHLSTALARSGSPSKAIRYAKQAVEVSRRKDPTGLEYALSLNNLAGVLAVNKQEAEAVEHLQHALKIVEALYKSNSHPMVVTGRKNLADLKAKVDGKVEL